MAGKVRSFSTLVENQLPEFISTDYPKFVKFVEKYYEQLETSGQPLDLINNLTKYQDIDTYEKKLLQESSILVSFVETTEIVITVQNGDSFPEKNGYVMIGEEVIFYQYRENNVFRNCYRNVSATTKLGDLYNTSEFKTVPYDEIGISSDVYPIGSVVTNISNLFLYAFVRNFETQYLASFPEENLKPTVDKKTLIKNIKYFYQAKGTDQSIKFIFNSIIAQEPDDIPSVYYPKDYTFKASNGEWITKYALKVKVLAGNVSEIIGQRITQSPDGLDPYAIKAFAVVDNVVDLGDNFYEIILAPETIVGEFKVAAETELTKPVSTSMSLDDIIDVFSTVGWDSISGKILVNNEQIIYKAKNINQFVIENRGQTPQSYSVGTKVYNYTSVESVYDDANGYPQSVKLIILGVLYNLRIDNGAPYSIDGDKVQESKTGFETRDPLIYDKFTGLSRWKLNETLANPASSLIPNVYKGNIEKLNSDVSAIYEDNQYYYITSSGFPSHDFGMTSWNNLLQDQKILKLIKKIPLVSTEIIETSTRDIGIAINGIPFYSCKDYAEIGGANNDVIFGGITEIILTSKGKGYQNPPYIIVEEKIGVETAKAKSILAGDVVDRIIIEDGGTGYFPPEPTITITSGRGGTAAALVTQGKITSIQLLNAGEYYSSPPEVEIIDSEGKGRFARYKTTISNDGKITGFIKENEGKFYTQQNVQVKIVSVGDGATAFASVNRWKKNRFNELKNVVDLSNGYNFENINPALGYGYSYIADPKALRVSIGDNLNSDGSTFTSLVHSKILGYAYDGNPIYGPYGFIDPLNSGSTIERMVSSYELNGGRLNGPPVASYPLGSFVEDYSYNHRLGTLDENNGRYCVTPEYPEGTYAYFITINVDNTPVFPYILGTTFYGVPTDSNYNKQISQNDLPKLVSRLRTDNIPDNGKNVFSFIEEVNSGSVSSLDIFDSHDTFSVGNLVEVNNSDTKGSGIIAKVEAVKGKPVTSIENRQIKAAQIRTKNTVYLFEGDTLYQQNTNAYGEIIGDVFDGNNIVLRNILGNFNTTDVLYSSIKVVNLIVNKSSNFTSGSILKLTNGKQVIISNVVTNTLNVSSNPFVNGEPIVFSNTFSGIVADTLYYVSNRTINSFQISETPTGPIIELTSTNLPTSIAVSEKCRGTILETTEDKNNIKVKTIQGEFVLDNSYFLSSSTRTDTVGVKISQINKLSENIEIFALNDNIGIATTTTQHNLAEGDLIDVTINPDDNLTNTTYYVRKRIYQKVKLKQPTFTSTIFDTGIGRLTVLNSGADYASNGSQTYTNVEIIFADQTKCRDIDGRIVGSNNTKAVLGNIGGSSNARATVTVTSGLVSNVNITSKGIGYKKGDLVAFSNTSLQRLEASISTQYFIAEVDHVGVSFSENTVKLNRVEGLSENDLIKIGKEILKVTSILANENKVTVSRAQENTIASDHYNMQPVTLFKSKYNLSIGYQIGNSLESGIVKSYDSNTQLLTIVYDLASSIDTINTVTLNSTFFDESSPKKLIGVDEIIENSDYRFEFSKINNISADWIRNPIIDIQKYYKYTFDTRHPSLVGSFIEFSPSGNYNILTLETHRSVEKPGSSGSFTEIKFGFGPFYDSSSLIVEGDLNDIKYTNYFYFDKNNIIKSDRSYLKVINDPLQGNKTITYVTPTKFVYELDKISPYDGTGTISYITTSSSAIGKIDSILISNPGKEFKKLPIVTGIRPAASLECNVTANWNSVTKTIDSVSINYAGINYSKPKAIVTDGDGVFAEFSISKNIDGSINAIFVDNKGKNYSYQPSIKIVETDIKAYFTSKNIGVPKNIKIVKNGFNFNRDFSISKKYSSVVILVVKDFVDNAFVEGEEIVQYDGSTLIAKATIANSGWREGSNILRLQSVEGIFTKELSILGKTRNNTANIVEFFATLFDSEIKSFYNNLGYYISDRSNMGSESQRIADSYFYQDYSYTIKSKTPTDVWRNLIKNTTHPAGFKVFGEVQINTKGSAEFIADPIKTNKVSFVQLWDPEKNRVTVESTRRVITTSVVKVKDINEVRGKGSAYVSPFDTTETISYELFLDPPFDGYIDQNGNRDGTKSFTIKIKGSGSLINVDNSNNLIISLDGIVQEPEKSFTVSDSNIIFSQAPLGKRFSEGSFGNAALSAINPVSTYKVKLEAVIGQLDLSYFVVNQEFTTSTSTRQLQFYNGAIITTLMDGTYKVIDKGVGGQFYNVVSFTNNIGNNTTTLVLSSVEGLDSNSAGLAIGGNGIAENSALQGIDLANNIITISGTVSSSIIGSVIIGNRYITVSPNGKLLSLLSTVYSSDVLNGITPFNSNITVDGYNIVTKSYFVDYNVRTYTVGVDTPSQDFVGKFIKFKDADLNSVNFKKIKDISSQFDNIKTSFALYYQDNTPVQLPSSDNLLISIDGVIQKSGITPLLPFDRAYYIRRTSVPNEIVFDEAPRKFEETISTDIFNKAKQSFFGYNVGAYERLIIDEQYVDGEFKGPFTLRSAFTEKTTSVDDDRNVLVFIDEILQKRLISYIIRGSNIIFNEAVRAGQKINIMYLYGRNSVKFLSMFDFDHNDYLNRIELQVNYDPEVKQFTDVLVYQGPSYENNTAVGYIKKFDAVETPLDVTSIVADGTTITVTTATPHNLRENQQLRVFGSSDNQYNIKRGFILPFDITLNSFKYQVPFAPQTSTTTAIVVYISTTFTLETQNKLFVTTKDVYCIDGLASGLGDTIIPKETINAVGQAISVTGGSTYFEETEETLDVLRKKTTGWLINSSLLPNYWNALDLHDEIKIDGEDEYRTILSIPTEVIKTEYRENGDVTTGYLGKISTTNYNGIQLGEGLDIAANVDTDISSPTFGQVLSLDWNKKDYLKYETKKIIPRPAGYSYEDAPRLNFVSQALKDEGGSIISPAAGGGARGYVVVHNGEPIDVVLTDPGSGYVYPPRVYITRGYSVKKSSENKRHLAFTQYFTPLIESTTLVVTSGSSTSSAEEAPIIYIENINSVKLVRRDIFITAIIKLKITPAIPKNQSQPESTSILELGTLKVNSISILSTLIYSSIETPLVKVQQESTVTLSGTKQETLLDVRSFLKLIQSPVYPGLYDTGAYLQSPLSKTDDIVYIADTSKFTASGRLMIDGEILRYQSKISDRFLNVLRGVDGTSVALHDAGAFVRQYRENVSIVSVGLTGAGAQSTVISIGSIGNLTASVSSITNIIELHQDTKIVDIAKQNTLIIQDIISTTSIVSVGVQVGPISYEVASVSVNVISAAVSNISSQVQKSVDIKLVDVSRELLLVIEETVNYDNVSIISIPVIIKDAIISTASINSIGLSISLVSSNQISILSDVKKIVFSVEKYYKTGIIDYYVETVALDGNILTRNNGIIILEPTITSVLLREGVFFDVINKSSTYDTSLDSYSIGNAGNNISTFESWKFMDTGTIPNSGTSIEDLQNNFGSLTLNDFQTIRYTSYALSNLYYNGGYPSISESGAILNTTMTTTSTSLSIQQPTSGSNPLAKFPTSGYILIGTELISYTGKTSISLTGVTRSINGIVSTHAIGDYLRTTN